MTREEFLVYVDHFNNKRYDAVTSYFTPDCRVEYFSNLGDPLGSEPKTLHGPQEFIQSYSKLHDHCKELLELGFFIQQGNQFVVELYTEFHCFKDYQLTTGPIKKGEVVIMTNWVVYDLRDDKFERIRIAHFRMHNSKPRLA